MCKLQLLNKNYNLLTKFDIEKSSSIHLANFLTWYEVETYTKNAPLKEFSSRQNSPYGSYHHHPQGRGKLLIPPGSRFIIKNIWRDYLLDFKILFFELSFLFIRSIGYPIQGSRVQNHRVAPRSTQPFILPRSIKLVPGNSGNLVVKSKLPPRSGSSLEAVEPHP